jgi:hypothetical protein
MRAKLLIALFAAALGVAGGWLGGSRVQKPREHVEVTQPTQQPEPKTKATETKEQPTNKQKDKPKSVSIPLDKVYSTSGQKGLQLLPEPPNERWVRGRKLLSEILDHSGASNAFLVVAPDIHDALTATQFCYLRNHNASIVQPETQFLKDPDVGSNTVWLHVFLGAGSDAEGWKLKSIDIENDTITFRCSTFMEIPGIPGFVNWGQAYWAPIPRPSASEVLIVIEEDSNPVPLFTRRVTIK